MHLHVIALFLIFVSLLRLVCRPVLVPLTLVTLLEEILCRVWNLSRPALAYIRLIEMPAHRPCSKRPTE